MISAFRGAPLDSIRVLLRLMPAALSIISLGANLRRRYFLALFICHFLAWSPTMSASQPSPERVEASAAECRRRTALEQYRQHVNSAMAGLCEMLGAGLEARSEGCYLVNEQGKQFLDCGGFNVFLLGHRHPRVVEAVKRQLDCHPLSSRLLLNEQYAQAASKLAEVAPVDCNTSGSPTQAPRPWKPPSSWPGSTAASGWWRWKAPIMAKRWAL